MNINTCVKTEPKMNLDTCIKKEPKMNHNTCIKTQPKQKRIKTEPTTVADYDFQVHLCGIKMNILLITSLYYSFYFLP